MITRASREFLSVSLTYAKWAFVIVSISISMTIHDEAHALSISQSLVNFTAMSRSNRLTVLGKGKNATLSTFQLLLAAKDVRLEIVELATNKSQVFRCKSFAYQLDGSFTICEVDDSESKRPVTVTVDLDASEVNYY